MLKNITLNPSRFDENKKKVIENRKITHYLDLNSLPEYLRKFLI